MNEQCQIAICDSTSASQDSEIWLWHSKMGRPNFQYLRCLFHSICSNKTSFDFQCEICELAKHHRTSLPKSNYKPSKLFIDRKSVV